jgi:CBS domain-containing protein
MGLLVGDIMQVKVETVDPEVALRDFDAAMMRGRLSGCPVVEAGRLVGVISRSDILRLLSLEHELAETTSDFYFDRDGFHEVPLSSYRQIAERVGERLEALKVRDAMSPHPVTVAPTDPVEEAAQRMIQLRIHRLPVVEHDRLVGIVTSLDLVQLFADRRVQAK